jgi:Chemoreceptor zinc-binding domain
LTKNDHVIFVKRVADAVAARQAIPPDSLATHHHCRLGCWYDSVADPGTLALPSFHAMMEPHCGVHDAARRALTANAEGDPNMAQRCVTEMRQHSDRVLQCLDEFGREYPSTFTQRGDRPEAAVA